MGWEKKFLTCNTNKGWVSRVYTGRQQVNKKKTWTGMSLKRKPSGYCMKRCPASLGKCRWKPQWGHTLHPPDWQTFISVAVFWGLFSTAGRRVNQCRPWENPRHYQGARNMRPSSFTPRNSYTRNPETRVRVFIAALLLITKLFNSTQLFVNNIMDK